MFRTAILLPAMLASCAPLPGPSGPLTGQWGGVHVGLQLSAAGGTLDYDCANGTIGPVALSADGKFAAEGMHTPGHGGPAREGEVLPAYRTQYSGRVSGDRMTLQGRVENGVLLGPFQLRRGAEPQLFRCL